jgi:heterodisulfide reductase subunit A
VESVEGEPGDFRATLIKKPRYVNLDKCTGCGTCVEYCPAKFPDPFNQGISGNKAIHIYFAQAIPLVTYIDESCLYLKEKKCRICETVCENKAIDFNQKAQKVEINVGAVILATGLEPFDASLRHDYGYGLMPNVVTSMDFERLLSSTGPYEGEILRASDKKHPRKIAWIQCVGSRQVNPLGGNSYCSAVCCTYTQKQVILAKEHDADAECTIFHNDIRAYGKDFERYYQRTENLPGVRFIRSYVSIGREMPETKNVTIRYSTTDDGVKEEEFDMVVLSVGLNPPTLAATMHKKFGIDMEDHGFCRVSPTNPMETSQPGIFVSGAFKGPVDIPESVFTASAAASQCGEMLDYRRGELSRERVYPAEQDVSQEDPRIGVFVCRCGANIGRIVDVPSAVDYALTLPNVVYAQEQMFSCATNSAKEITDKIKEKGLNRVILAACSPRTLEPLFRDTLREAGINQYYLDMANIREHCSWVHAREPEAATAKAKDIIRMSVARAAYLRPLQEMTLNVNKNALVVGGGIAGMTTALSIANQGHEVYLIEKDKELGGMARRLYYTLEGMDVQMYLHDLIKKVYKHPLIHVYPEAVITDAAGYIGNFVTTVKFQGRIVEIKHGVAVVAIGADEYKPVEYLYGQDDRVMTQLELEEKIAHADETLLNAESLVMIQCVGSREEGRNYCSRVCCSQAVKNALKLKELKPEMQIYILFRDMRTYGFSEDYYREAANRDVKFIRYEPDDKPVVEATVEEGRPVVRVTVTDPVLGQKIAIDADAVALAAAVIPAKDSRDVAGFFKVTRGLDGFFTEAHVKLKPVEFSTDGVYLCGTAHYPKHVTETISQAYGAAGRVMIPLSHDTLAASGAVCRVEEEKCVTCGACISICTYGAIDFNDTALGRKARVNPVLCKGCGVCNTVCPTEAIQLQHFTDQEILSQVDAALEGM